MFGRLRPAGPGPAAARIPAPTLVFLHIPKTAGQSIVREVSRIVGRDATSPVRTHTQAARDAQMPPGYRFYAGHLDWTGLDDLPADRFVFSVLRDPRERIASFYFYLLREAARLSPAELQTKQRTGMRMVSTHSADDYFFGGEKPWQHFIQDHYDNFYCTYFSTRRMRGWNTVRRLAPADLLDRAMAGAAALSRVYGLGDLGALEADLAARLGQPVNLRDTRVNVGPPPQAASRWDDLLARFERDDSRARLERYADTDMALMRRLGLAG